MFDGLVFTQDIYRANIPKILAVTTIGLDDGCMKFVVLSVRQSRVSTIVLESRQMARDDWQEMWCAHARDSSVHAWYLRSVYLESLGCHDPAFGCCVLDVCRTECGAPSRVSIAVLGADKWREIWCEHARDLDVQGGDSRCEYRISWLSRPFFWMMGVWSLLCGVRWTKRRQYGNTGKDEGSFDEIMYIAGYLLSETSPLLEV
jgi:hypothetical protein